MPRKVPGRTVAPEDRIRSSWWLEPGGEARRSALDATDRLDVAGDDPADAVQIVVRDLHDHIVWTGYGVDFGEPSAVAVLGHLGELHGHGLCLADIRLDQNVGVYRHNSYLLSRGAGLLCPEFLPDGRKGLFLYVLPALV